MVLQFGNQIVCEVKTEFLELYGRCPFSNAIHFINRQCPIFVLKPIVVEFNLACHLLSVMTFDPYVLREGYDPPLSPDTKNPYRLISWIRACLARTDDVA